MSKYSQAVIAKKPEFSYLDTDAPLRETYSDGTVNAYNPKVFPYAESFMRTVLKRVNDTYAAVVEDEHRQTLCRELYRQLKHDFRFDFSDHLGPMRQRDKRGAGAAVEENDYNMFHSCYKFVNQAARARSFGEKFNLSLMSGRVNTDNQTGPEICDPFVFGPPLYLYSKIYPKVIAMTLPGFDTPEKIAALKAHEKEMKKDMFEKKALAAKALKARWHHLINKEFMPQGMEFKDLSMNTVKALSELHKDVLTEFSAQVEQQFQNDVRMLKKVMKLLDRQMTYHKAKGTPENDLAALQLASVHAMQANDLLKDSSVVQISIEAEKPIFAFMADVLDNPRSLTAQIFDNPQTRAVFETEMKKIHTTKSGGEYTHLLDRMVPAGSGKMPAYTRMLGDEYDKDMSRGQIAEALRSGEAMPKVSFMLAVVLLETGAKIEGGSSQIVYARRIKEALGKVFDEAGRQPDFDRKDIAARRAVVEKFDYRTAQAQIWGVKENGNVLGYRDLVDGSVKINDKLLDSVASVSSRAAFDAASVHRFYSFVTGEPMNETETAAQKERVKGNLLRFADNGDFNRILAPGSAFYKRLANIIRNDENVTDRQVQHTYMSNKMQTAAGF